MNIEEIIKKLSEENLSPEDREQLESWKNETEDNAKAILLLRAMNEADLSGYEDYDADSAWDKFKSEVIDNEVTATEDEPKVIAEPKVVTPNFQWMKVAAMLLVIFGALSIYFINYKDGNSAVGPKQYTTNVNKKSIDFEDGTIITLDKNSNLLETDDRNVKLSGRAYFNVVSDASSPFTVETSAGVITVVGTEFSVISTDSVVEVYVTEGKVIYNDSLRKLDLVIGDYIKVENGDITKVTNVSSNYLSWKNGELNFVDTPLAEVIKSISRHFDKEIIILNEQTIAKCKLTSKFTNESISDVLTELKDVLGLKYRKNGNLIEVIGSDC